jgi:hypothetical protein
MRTRALVLSSILPLVIAMAPSVTQAQRTDSGNCRGVVYSWSPSRSYDCSSYDASVARAARDVARDVSRRARNESRDAARWARVQTRAYSTAARADARAWDRAMSRARVGVRASELRERLRDREDARRYEMRNRYYYRW